MCFSAILKIATDKRFTGLRDVGKILVDETVVSLFLLTLAHCTTSSRPEFQQDGRDRKPEWYRADSARNWLGSGRSINHQGYRRRADDMF